MDAHNEFVEKYNTNARNFGNALQALDSKVGAIALAVDDFIKGGVENVTRLAEGDVDGTLDSVGKVHWAAYIKHYVAQVQAEIEKERARAEQAATVPFDPLITPPDEVAEDTSNDVVFGGQESSDGEASTGHEATSAPL